MVSKRSIEAKYKRAHINSSQTFLFSELPEKVRMNFQSIIDLKENEDCIICYIKSAEYSLIVTNIRIIIVRKNNITSYFHSLIKEVRLDSIFNEEQNKKQNNNINIIMEDGNEINLIVEKGTWHVLYSIIKILTQ